MNINDLKIIDTHHHLWDPTTNKYDWLTASGHEVFNHVYRKENFINDFQGLNVVKSVHVQAEINLADTIYETEWIQQISEAENDSNDNKLPNAIIGFADFLDSHVEQTLEMHLQYPNFRGIRHILNYDKNNKEISHAKFDYLKEDLWLKNFSLLEKNNLSFDLSILFNQTEDAVKLVNEYSNTNCLIGDGFCDDNTWGMYLDCPEFDCDGGDCPDLDCDGGDGGSTTGGGTTGGGTAACDDCDFDFTAYGAECCDAAYEAFGITCAALEADYNWDCSGCNCPGDSDPVCGDGFCNGDEDYYNCPDDCLAPGECEEGFITDCAFSWS
jgi:hypothetical protein